MKILSDKQGSASWLQARIGRITASRVVDVMNFRKDGKPGADRVRYFGEVLCERLTGIATEHYVSPYMEHGTEMEPLARASYEVATGNDVEQIGIAIHPTMDYFSCSPDGLVNADGIVEFKAPAMITHLNWLLAGEVPEEHKAQIYSGMVCCEREWGDFCSYDDRFPDPLKRFIKRLDYDKAKIAEIESAVRQFHEEVEAMIDKLQSIYGKFVIPAQIAAKVQRADDGTGISSDDIDWAKKNL
jgi:putative phage-type endonuclease